MAGLNVSDSCHQCGKPDCIQYNSNCDEDRDEYYYNNKPFKGKSGDRTTIHKCDPQGESDCTVQKGDTGPTGPRGCQGEPGPKGEPGRPGPQGEMGCRGPQGDQGDPGPQGPTGSEGPSGIRGPAGPRGDKGDKGDKGCTGPVGSRGPAGPQGIQGLQGVRGDIGPQGDPGCQGPQGVKGNPGPQGPAGSKGGVGPKGDVGPMGPQGPAGPEGPMGPQGPVGSEGPIGPQGPAGERGEKGPLGPKGCQGPQGEQGPQGIPGPIGEIGPTGPIGPCGDGNTIFVSTDSPKTLSANFGIIIGNAKSYDDFDISLEYLYNNSKIFECTMLMLRDSYITDMGLCLYLCSENCVIKSNFTIIAQLWSASNTCNKFEPLQEAIIKAPILADRINSNNCIFETKTLKQPVFIKSGSRILYVVSLYLSDQLKEITIKTSINGSFIMR